MIGYRNKIALAQLRILEQAKSVKTHSWKPPERPRGLVVNYAAAKDNGKLGRKKTTIY